MNDSKERILEINAREYFIEGDEALKKSRFNSSVVLFFKALISLMDLFLIKNLGYVPSSHISRFSLTKKYYPKIYRLLDKDFPFYQESYSKLMSKELAEVIKEDAEFMAKEAKIKL